MRMRSVGPVIAVFAMTCVGLAADDKWETGYIGDDTSFTPNQLTHGAIQTHDIQGVGDPTDRDFSVVGAKARHSYEVRVFSLNACFTLGGQFSCASLDRVAADTTTILTAGIAPDGLLLPNAKVGWLTVRWIADADAHDLIRVNGYTSGAGATVEQYDIQMLDTTYLVPRWNNSGTQITVFLIQNGSNAPITGSIFFYNGAGALLATQPLTLAANALQVLSTAGIPALAGASGSAAIAHDGGYGALAGKAVALEPSTGFTFDTLIAPIPH
jgi:hypothetical protein